MSFGHEKLDVYRVALGVARWAARQAIPSHRRHLRDHEGAGHPPGDARRHHFRIALGSAAEAAAVLDLLDLPGTIERQAELRRVGAMLGKMSRA